MSPPTITIVVPARDEEANIAACVAAIAGQDHPLDQIEVIVVDGSASSGTAEAAGAAFASHPDLRARLLRTDQGSIAHNLNTGLAAATGDIVCRVDAKSRLPADYVRRCVEALSADPGRTVVGGWPLAVAARDTVTARAIARAYNNRWATGLSRYKRGGPSGPSDTVYLGAFHTARLRDTGGWDERLVVNEDFELNQRLGRDGTVWFDADLCVGHVHGSVSMVDLFRRQRRLGRGKVRYWRLTGRRPRPRQWLLLLSPVAAGAAATVWIASGRRPGGRLATATLLGSTALLAVEAAGTDEPPAGGPLGHAAGAAACAAVGVGWLVGIGEGLIGNREP